MTRILLTDTIPQILVKMAGGFPGAVVALLELVKNEPEIDPDSCMLGYGAVLTLDHLNIYESSIWILYSDICKKDVVKLIALLRAIQLGFIDAESIQYMALRQDRGGVNMVDLEAIHQKVCDRLPKFKKPV